MAACVRALTTWVVIHALAIGVTPTVAAAQATSFEPPVSQRDLMAPDIEYGGRGEGRFSVAGHVRSDAFGATWLVAPSVSGWWEPVHGAGVWIDVPFAYASVADATARHSGVSPGSFSIGARLWRRFGRFQLRSEPGLFLPTAWIDDANPNAAVVYFALHNATAAFGRWARYRFLPEVTGLTVPVAFRHDWPVVALEGEVGTWLALPLGDSTPDVEMDVQLGVRLELGGGDVRGGLLTRLVLGVLTTESDRAQLSVSPYVRWDFTRAFLEAELIVNLDTPGGFSFASNGVWALQLAVGGKF